jgi:hypothetical protein
MDGRMILITVLVILGVWLLWSRRHEGFSQQIPKHIWTYWEDGDPPELVRKCLSKWFDFNPGWTITILDKNNLIDYIPEVDIFSLKFSDTVPRRSDFVRLHVLSKYGGVWADASILPTKSFDWVQDVGSYDFIGYYRKGVTTRPEYPVIESWFFACPPGSKFVSKLRDEMMSMNTLAKEGDYKKNVVSRGVDIQNIPQPDYLNIYLAAQAVLQKQMTQEEIKRTIYVKPAEDGPFKHAVENNWDPEKTIKSLCNNQASDVPDMVKIYGNERQTIEGNSELKCIYKILDDNKSS